MSYFGSNLMDRLHGFETMYDSFCFTTKCIPSGL
nr:MAG TPA: hypothetical protein [Caudoviricetes sp.]